MRVTIVGGGPGGAAVARALLAESPEFEIDMFEARTAFGGLWNYSPTSGPMYRDLDANIPRELIPYKGFPFPDGNGYPTRQEVLQYLQHYAHEVTNSVNIKIRFGTKVEQVVKRGNQWLTRTDKHEDVLSDFVVLATGHYEFPYWPAISGLQEHPGVIHSVQYNAPEEFAGKKTLIIGNARSGTDLALQLLGVTYPLAISRRKVGPSDPIFDEDPGSVVWKPEVTKVVGAEVYFADGTHEKFDRIIASTGYLYKFPFLEVDSKASIHHESLLRFQNIYKHTFYAEDPTVATLGVNKGVVPFPIMEAQAAVIARVWNSRLKLPDREVMRQDEAKIALERGTDEKFHELSTSEDLAFMEELWDWADQAPGGFVAERWSPQKMQLRTEIGKQKEADYRKKVIGAKLLREGKLTNRTT